MGLIEGRRPREPLHDEGARGDQLDQLLEALTDLGQLGLGGEAEHTGASRHDATPQEAVTGDGLVQAQKVLAKGERPGLGDPEPDVVAQRTDVGNMVVETFEFQQRTPQELARPPAPGSAGRPPRPGSRPARARRRCPRDPLSDLEAGGDVFSLAQPFDPLVDEPQPGLHPQDGLPHHPEAEMPGLDEPGVHRSDRDLVHTGAFDRDERERSGVGDHRGDVARSVAHRMPALRPVLMEHQAPGLGVVDGLDPEEVGKLALEPGGGKREPGQGGHLAAATGRWVHGARHGCRAGRR